MSVEEHMEAYQRGFDDGKRIYGANPLHYVWALFFGMLVGAAVLLAVLKPCP